jgi:cold shock CspA family protein
MQGIVERIARDRQVGFIRGDDGREFEFEPQSLSGLEFDSLTLGTRVDFDEASEDQMPHAEAIRLAEDQLRPVPADEIEPSKAADPEAQATASQVPPEAVDTPEDESSWESFPASDAPTPHNIT